MPINPSNLDMSVSSRATLSFQDRLPNLGHVWRNGIEGKIQSQIQFLAMIFRSNLPTIQTFFPNLDSIQLLCLAPIFIIQIFHT